MSLPLGRAWLGIESCPSRVVLLCARSMAQEPAALSPGRPIAPPRAGRKAEAKG